MKIYTLKPLNLHRLKLEKVSFTVSIVNETESALCGLVFFLVLLQTEVKGQT